MTILQGSVWKMLKKRKEFQFLLYDPQPPWLGMLSHPWRLSRLLSDSWTGVWQSLQCGMTTAPRKCAGQITGEKFETQLTFRKPTAKGKLCSYPLRHTHTHTHNKCKSPPQNLMLIFPKCWRNVNQNDNGKSNFTTHNGHHHKSTKNKFGREPGGKRIILSCWWEDTWHQPV